MVSVAVLGYGTVGSGVVEVIENNNSEVSVKAGEEMHVKYILDLRDFPGDPYEDRVIHDFDRILNDAEISIVCEVMGGVGAAYQFTKKALEAGHEAQELLDELDRLLKEMKETDLPATREEFESRAILYLILMNFEYSF